MSLLRPNFKDIRVRNLAVLNSLESIGSLNAEDLVINNLEVQGNIKVNSNNAFKQGGQFWNVLSDRSTKKNISQLNNASLAQHFDKINVYRFQYIDQADDKEFIGVMADEIEQLFPDAVAEVEGKKTVDTSYLFWCMFTKIRQQQHELDQVKLRLERLETKLSN